MRLRSSYNRASAVGVIMTRALAAIVGFALAACADPGTAVRLELTYDPAWSLDRLDLEVGDVPASTRIARTVVVLLPDDSAGQAMAITVVALRGGERYAAARVGMTPELGKEIAVDVVLTRLPCGAWCTPGATTCDGDGVAICEQRDSDACMEWSEPVACPTTAASCSLGVCAAQCIEECVAGESRCDGPAAEAACGNADGDACRDWLPSVACAAGETCSNGRCRATCADECAAGAAMCVGNGVATCGDLDFDGCLEWGPAVGCDAGTTCSNGACAAECADECTTSTCDGLTLRTCGNFDLDPCTDLSPGTSCVPADPCREGMCTVGGCTSAPKVCNDPPESTCVGDAVRTYDAAGTCTATGACEYTPHDMTCANGCISGACVVASCTPGAWQLTTVASDGYVGWSSSLALDGAGGVHIGYHNTTLDSLEYAYLPPGGSWATTTVDASPGDVGGDLSLAVDGAGGVHVSYLNWSDGDLKYAYKAPGGGWATTTVAAAGNVGKYTSLAVDAAGNVHLSYYDTWNEDLMYVTKPPGGAWATPTTVASANNVGVGTALVVDSARGVHVSYFDATNDDLVYVRKPAGGAWSTRTTVDATGDVGSNVSMAIDGAGGLHVSYVDRTDPDVSYLKYASRSPGGVWATPTRLGPVSIVRPSLAIDSARRVHLSYHDPSTNKLTYITKPAGGAWSTPTGVAPSPGGASTSLAVDSAGGIHISYYNSPNGDLKYAYRCPE